ncbi:MAG: c-type cytochrome domain-containing protein, partial [Planctomycetaceae bacterium]
MLDPHVRRLVLLALAIACAPIAAFAADEKITYDDHVLPIIQQKCAGCHNTDKKTAGLDLTSYLTAMQGGASGESIIPGSAPDSYLFNLINHDSEPFMPPNQPKLPAEMLATIGKWIDGGALENAGSKPIASKKPKMDLSLSSVTIGKPDGPPPMFPRLPLEPVVHTGRTTAVTALATNPWSPLVAVAGQKQVLLYHAGTLELTGVLPFPEGVPFVLKFSRNGQLLLAAGGQGAFSGKAVVWNVKTGERVIEVGNEVDAVLAA